MRALPAKGVRSLRAQARLIQTLNMDQAVYSPIERVEVAAYRVPTEAPESDGTLTWSSTTMVVAHIHAGGRTGLGYTYADRSAATLIKDRLAELLVGGNAVDIPAHEASLVRAIRNLGRPGVCSSAISAVDAALWDLKARLFDVPLVTLLGAARSRVPLYGSGGFTSQTTEELCGQLGGWVSSGFSRVKMKVGREPSADVGRVRAVRQAIGPHTELFVDANGAYGRKQALAMAEAFAEFGVRWFEEPVSSDDLAGLALMRNRGPAGMDVAAGEYGYDLPYFSRMLGAQAVDVLQADASRCGGPTGFLRVAALTDGLSVPLSAHTAPALHLPLCLAAPRLAHLEYFHDHVRIESLLFAGVQKPVEGELAADLGRAGFGLELKRKEAERFLH
jgi:L-alanine-DL-glutamate epimerase-like enolase superfamily enzyme